MSSRNCSTNTGSLRVRIAVLMRLASFAPRIFLKISDEQWTTQAFDKYIDAFGAVRQPSSRCAKDTSKEKITHGEVTNSIAGFHLNREKEFADFMSDAVKDACEIKMPAFEGWSCESTAREELFRRTSSKQSCWTRATKRRAHCLIA